MIQPQFQRSKSCNVKKIKTKTEKYSKKIKRRYLISKFKRSQEDSKRKISNQPEKRVLRTIMTDNVIDQLIKDGQTSS